MLPKRERLSKGREIQAALKLRQHVGGGTLLYLVARENGLGWSRVVMVVRRSIGKAAKRNRLRRVLLAAFIKIRHNFAKNIDLVLYPRSMAVSSSSSDIGKDMALVLGRLKLI